MSNGKTLKAFVTGNANNTNTAATSSTVITPFNGNNQAWSSTPMPATGTTTIWSGPASPVVTEPDMAKLKEELKFEIAEVKVCLLVEIESLNEKILALMKMIENLSVRICEGCHARVEEGQVHVCLSEQAERQSVEEEESRKLAFAMLDR